MLAGEAGRVASPCTHAPGVVRTVGVAQLVERRVVVADVAGSSPVTHPSVTHDEGARRLTAGPFVVISE